MPEQNEQPVFDYGDFADMQAAVSDLERLQNLIQMQVEAEAYVEACTERLDEATRSLNNLKFFTVPDLMDKLSIKNHTTTKGVELKMSEVIRGSIPEVNAEKAFAWLEENDYGKLIKRTFNIEFGKGDEAWANKFERDCAARKRPLNLKRKKGVHAQTLQAFVRAELEKGTDIPMELFGVYRQRFAKVKIPTRE